MLALRGVDGPDFICVGLPKAGTGWLFDQLNDHPDFWMPPVKEFLYLQKPVTRMRFVKPSGEPRGNSRGAERRVHRQNLDARDHAFLEFAAACSGHERDLERYAKFFDIKGSLLSGDISPPYCALKDDMIEAVGARFPKTRIVLLVRDPVSRAWSRIAMAERDGLFNEALLDNPARFKRYVENNKKIGSIRATEVVERWRRLAPDNPFRWFLFDDIAERPDQTRRDILNYLGADPQKKGADLAPDYNRKADARKLEMNAMSRSVLAEHYADELEEGAKFFGGAAASWPGKYAQP